MDRESRSERIARRRQEAAAGDRQNRRLFLGVVALFALAVIAVLLARWVQSGPIDLNRASLERLESLPGIGPETAKAIVGGRPYRGIDDVERIKGIGPATMEKLRGRITVGE